MAGRLCAAVSAATAHCLLLSCWGCWRWDRALPGAQVVDNLRDLLVGERVGKWRHLLSAVENLVLELLRRPALVFPDVGQRRTLLCALTIGAMAMSASLIAKQDCAGHFVAIVRRCPNGSDGKKCEGYKNEGRNEGSSAFPMKHHIRYFRIAGPNSAAPSDGGPRFGSCFLAKNLTE